MDGNGLDDGTKCFTIINAGLLMKAFGNEECFVPFNGAISVSFDTKNSFAAHKINMGF
jgi:hypothetical protein